MPSGTNQICLGLLSYACKYIDTSTRRGVIQALIGERPRCRPTCGASLRTRFGAGKGKLVNCDDGSTCTAGDACKAGNCVAGKALVCDDKNACTNDSCDPANKAKPCQYKPNTSLCDDNSKCTVIDACKDGKCQGTKPLACTDGEVCTKDTCDAAKGCLFTPVDVKCSDGALCTDKDACKAGKCLGVAKNCDDGNDCTVDSCDLAPARSAKTATSVPATTAASTASAKPARPCPSAATRT